MNDPVCDAQPVAWVVEGEGGRFITESLRFARQYEPESTVVPLFAHPPTAAAAVPDTRPALDEALGLLHRVLANHREPDNPGDDWLRVSVMHVETLKSLRVSAAALSERSTRPALDETHYGPHPAGYGMTKHKGPRSSCVDPSCVDPE